VDQAALGGADHAGVRALIKQVLQDGRGTGVGDLAGQGLGWLKGALCAPLKLGRRLDGNERVAGAIYVDSARRRLAQPELERLEAVAAYASVSLETASLLARSEEARAQILRLKDNVTRLYDVGRSLSSTLILQDLLVLVVDHVVEISRAQRGYIMLLEGTGAGRHLDFKAGRDARKRNLASEHFGFSTTITQRALAERRSVVMTTMPEQDLSKSIVQMELQSVMCVPLKEKEEVIGLVYVDSQQSNKEFDASDLEVVESLCGQAAVAIVNAKLYHEAGEKQRLAHELDIAAQLQRDMLPKTIPEVRGLELHGLLVPATEVGGDYYDFIPHDKTKESLTVAIGDVSGKGVGAGLVMAMARSALRSLIQHHGAPQGPLQIVRSLNVTLCRGIPPNMFMTLNVLVWDAAAQTLRYTPCGHEHLLVYRGVPRTVEVIKAGGVAAGVLEQASNMLKEHELSLMPGDQLLLYTDGVTEAMDLVHAQFGRERLVEMVAEHGHRSPQELCETILAALEEHRGAADRHDDITLVALRATG
jgi:sigma-B regulation protein RsbU (phosphoserine phosphatase)